MEETPHKSDTISHTSRSSRSDDVVELRSRKSGKNANPSFYVNTEEEPHDVTNEKTVNFYLEQNGGTQIAASTGSAKGRFVPGFLKDLLPSNYNLEATKTPDLVRNFSTLAKHSEFEALFEDRRDESSVNFDANWVSRSQRALALGWTTHHSIIMKSIAIFCLLCYSVYFAYAIYYSPEGAAALIIITGLVLLYIGYAAFRDRFGDAIYRKWLKPFSDWWDRNFHIIKWFLYPFLIIATIVYLTMVVIQHAVQLQSISGFIIFFLYNFLTSRHPDKIDWRPVIWGYSLQFILAILVLQWEPGYIAVKWLSDLIELFINFGYEGAALVFGDPTMVLHPFAFMGMPLIIYVGSVMGILYYYGLTQRVAKASAWILQVTMKTTAIETLGVASNIFLNGMDVMMMLRFYIDRLTPSEFNCFAVGSNATLAGFIFGLLILYGTPPQHLLTGAVMSAPATIAIAKMNWPETAPHLSQTKNMDDIEFEKGSETSMFEAAANGSSVAGKTALTVLINYISFISILALIDAFLAWVGWRVGFPYLSFEWICSILFWPLALIIGIEVDQCREVAKIIGIKVFTTEIYGYQALGASYNQGLIDERSRAVTTYALCGFCSLSTLAIAVGVWEAVCPTRRQFFATHMVRILVQANISCFTTACVAGLFYSEKIKLFEVAPDTPAQEFVGWLLGLIPSYKTLLEAAGLNIA